MKSVKRCAKMTIIIVMVQFSHNTAYTQLIESKSTLSNGGGNFSSNSFQINSTIGQPITGIMSSATYINEVGFWLLPSASSSATKCHVNFDGIINVVDIQLIVNIFLETYNPTPLEFWAADANDDGKINVIDVQRCVNKFLEGSNLSSKATFTSQVSVQGDTVEVVGGEGDRGTTDNIVPINLANTVDVTAMSFDLIDQPNILTSDTAKVTTRTNGFLIGINKNGRVILFNLSGSVITPSKGPILEILYGTADETNVCNISLTLENVVLSDSSAKPIENVALVNGEFDIINHPPSSFGLLMPTNGAKVDTLNPELVWETAVDEDVGDTVSYELIISTSSALSDTVIFAQSNDRTYTASDGLEPAKQYYWKVIAVDKCDVRTESNEVFMFMTSDVATDIDGQVFGLLPEKMSLSQNFPNPFNPQTIIRYELSTESEVTIAIYNIRGQKIKILINQNKSAGIHEVIWDGKDDTGKEVSGGVYVYQIKAGAFTESKKLIFLQ